MLNLWVGETAVYSCNETALLTWDVISLQKITVEREFMKCEAYNIKI
jgi:hypothetical protein